MSLPNNLNYNGKIEASPAVSFSSSIAPQNGSTYTFGSTILINIPTQNNLVMCTTESYLKFKMTVPLNGATASAWRWDLPGAHGLIESIKVYHGSNLLSSITSYGMLAKLIFAFGVPSDAIKGKYNAMAGTRPDTDIMAGDGDSLAATAAAKTYSYALNLISLIGSLNSSQYLPLFALTSGPLRVEIQLVNGAVNAMNQILAFTPTLTDFEFVANFIKLSDEAMALIYGSLNGKQLQVCLNDWANFQDTRALTTSLTTVSFAIPAKYSSLRALFVTGRSTVGALTYFPYSSTKQGSTQYYFRVGPNILPSKAPNTMAQYYVETAKAIGSLADVMYTPVCNMKAFQLDVDTALDATTISTKDSGCFAIGLDLENYVNAAKSGIFAGYSSNNDDIYAMIDFTAASAVPSYRLDAFAMFDSVLVFENNTCYRKF